MSTCTNCEAPITAMRGGRFCTRPACRRAYQREYEANQRKRPGRVRQGLPQPGLPDLPPLGELVASADGSRIQCHACGRWYGALSGHLRSHGMSPGDYRELYKLPRGQSLAAPALSERLSERAIRQDLGELGRRNLAALPPFAGRPSGTPARLGERIGKSRAARRS